MTALNFPDSPSNGDTYQGYTYNSTKSAWAKPDSPDPDARTAVYANIAALPTSGTAGDMAYVTATNRLYIWTGTGWYNIALINTNPTISGVSSSYALAIDGTATTVTITASDPEGLPITYSIVSDTSGNSATVAQGTGSNTNVFTITPSTNTAHAGTFSLTFRASDGVNIASSAASFTLQFSVENQNYTTALITSVGANLADNNDFVDSSTNSHTITAAGNATQNTFSPYRHGGYSTYFDGSGDYLQPAGTTIFDISSSTATFTVEAWIYPTTMVAGSAEFRFASIISKGAVFVSFGYKSDGTLRFYTYNGSQNYINSTSTGVVEAGRWQHVAVVSNAGSVTLYVDGSSVGTGTLAAPSAPGVGVAPKIGAADTGQSADFVNGYIADLRVIDGSAVTPSSGGPTERLTAITNTSLLACHLPYIADGSTNGHAITVNGNTKTEPFAPYDEYEYASGTHGGSMYFDGAGDYLSATYDVGFNMGATTDFTMEAWVYQINQTGNHTIFAQYAGTGTAHSEVNGHRWIFWIDDGQVQLYQYPDMTTQLKDSGTLKLNTWNHVAATREGSVFRLFVNGVQVSTVTSSTVEVGFLNDPLTVGYYNSTGYFNGIISDVRLVKGTAVYTSAFTPPTAPLTAITNTSMLLNGTNAGIIDKSQSVKTITLNGDTKSSTTQTKYLSSSMYFDGAGDYITMTPSDLFAFRTGDFTIEGWAYITATGDRGLFQQGTSNFPASNSNSVALQITNASPANSEWAIYAGNAYHESTVNYALNQWYHFAVVRASSVTKLYINGTEALSVSDSVDYTGTYFGVGSIYGAANAQCFTGYMSDFRVTKGLARYTSNFTPPTAALQG